MCEKICHGKLTENQFKCFVIQIPGQKVGQIAALAALPQPHFGRKTNRGQRQKTILLINSVQTAVPRCPLVFIQIVLRRPYAARWYAP
jgi:hypothetical protein